MAKAVKPKPKKKAAPKKAVKKSAPKKNGRPELYTPELADKICQLISTTTKSLKTICAMEGMPSVETVLRWLREDKDGFCGQYAKAKEEQSDFLIEEMLEISDHSDEDHTPFTGGNVVQRDRLRIDTRKWIASKLKPKKYGDKLDLTSDGNEIKAPTTIIKWGDKEITV